MARARTSFQMCSRIPHWAARKSEDLRAGAAFTNGDHGRGLAHKSERTILISDTEKPYLSYNDLAGFPDRTLRSHSSQPAARPQSNSFAIKRPPMPPRRNGGRT